jgi:predicted phage terminase large subunit-like protein
MLSVPPRHGKSELVSIALPSWFLGRNPDKKVMIASYAADLAHTMSRRARNAFETHSGAVFGVRTARDSSRADMWGIEGRRGGMLAIGERGGATGHGFHLGIVDDPVKDAQDAESKVIREKVKEWWSYVFRTRAEGDAPVILVQTRWHEDDLAGWLLREAEVGGAQWEVINFPFHDDTKPFPESILSPRNWEQAGTPEKLEAYKKEIGSSRAWEALYQGRPTPLEGGLLKREWWKYYTQRPTCETMLQSWDMSFKDTDGSDYVVGQVWGKNKADYYLLDQVRARMDMPATVQALRALSRKWPAATMKLVEEAANGPAVIQTLRAEKEIEGVVGVKPQGSKEARAAAVSPLIEAGNVYLPDRSLAPWVGDFVEECTAFPSGAHDDCVDSMSQALTRLMRYGGQVVQMRNAERRRAEM